jgi:uncharacterized protein (DUF58 family)
LLSYDVGRRFPRLGRWIRHPAAIMGMAAVAAVLCGAFLNPRAFLFAAGIAAAMALGLLWPWISIRGLAGTIEFDRPRSAESEPVRLRVRIRNRLPWSACGLSIPCDLESGGDDALALGMARAGGLATTEIDCLITPSCRGVYPGGRVHVQTGFPFGLRSSSRPIECPAPLLVWPRTFPVGPLPETAHGREGEGLAARPRPGSSGDVLGVRPYRRGDSLRRIHWPQTARHGQLVVCELHSTAIPRVQIVLDADPSVHAGHGPNASLEWAVRIAASFAVGWLKQGAEIELVLGPDRLKLPETRSLSARSAALLDALARLDASQSAGLADILSTPMCRRPREDFQVVITTDRRLAEGALPPSAVPRRCVVLAVGGFGGLAIEPAGQSERPWIHIDDPAGASRRLLDRCHREVAHV